MNVAAFGRGSRIRSLAGRIRRRIKRRINRRAVTRGPLENALEELLTIRGSLSIVQVGANDGRLNDPIYPFISRHPDQTRLLLIEPQEFLLPELTRTYAQHPSATIVQCAIGVAGVTTLWTVNEDCWSEFRPAYSEAWPAYRAPSGITSETKSHVEEQIARQYTGDLPVEEVLTSFDIESRPLLDVLDSSGFGFGIDLLQVDTEGSDDVVIMNSAIAQLRPALINFESAHLSENRLAALCAHLTTNGYEISDNGRDALAVRAGL